jgi:uncharacterized protein (DUF2147 family)
MKSLPRLFLTRTAVTTFLVAVMVMPASAQTVVNPVGLWAAKDGSVSVQIAPCEAKDAYCGTVTKEKLEAGAQSQMGKTVIKDLKFDRKKGWRGIFLADDGGTYKATAKFRGATEVAFKICAFAFLCDTQIFSKQ